MNQSERMSSLEEGLKLVGLLTPEAREKIVEAFLSLEAENMRLRTELATLSTNVTRIDTDLDKMKHHLSRAGSQY